MENEQHNFINNLDKLKKSNDEFISLTNALLSSDLDNDHKLVSITSILNAVIKNQSFIFDTIKSHTELISEQRTAIINIIDKID